ncbi:hypothetical protein CRUP_003394 [Coryphaenoides rupestris]|nr:hypothetical protein CRUP_003394 [Coryphaenoides rupestris]
MAPAARETSPPPLSQLAPGPRSPCRPHRQTAGPPISHEKPNRSQRVFPATDSNPPRVQLPARAPDRHVRVAESRISFFSSGSENLHRVEQVAWGTRFAITVSFTCDPVHAIADPTLP